MYSPEGQNKTIPLFLQENKGKLGYSLILFSVLRSFAKIRIFFIHPYTFVMQKLVDFLHLYLDMYNLVLYMQR